MARSLNRVQLIGNLTRDPELRYTPNGTAVCSFGLATNRSWTTDAGEKREEVEFHRIVSWNKLAELCSQFLAKGRKVYVEGRLATRSWTAQDGAQRNATEIVIDDMILLDSRRPETETKDIQGTKGTEETHSTDSTSSLRAGSGQAEETKETEEESKKPVNKKEPEEKTEEVTPDDIPF